MATILLLGIIELLLVACFLCLLAFLPNGYQKLGKLRKNKVLMNEINGIADSQRQSEIDALSKCAELGEALKNETIPYFIKKLIAAIEYGSRRHDWYEDQRSRIFQASMTILSAVLAILAIVSHIDLADSQFAILAGFGAITIASVLRMVFLYNQELDAERPYRLISDIRFWFYRYNLPNPTQSEVTENNAKEVARGVASNRRHFFERALENSNIANSIREDIEQIFILHTLQRHKSEVAG